MILENSVQSFAPVAPPYFNNCIFMNASYPMPEQTANLFTKGLEVLSKVLYEKEIDPNNFLSVNLIFTKDGSFSIKENMSIAYGRCFQLIIYAIEKIEQCNDKMKLFIFIEELVHYYFQEKDETKTKILTFMIVKKVFPDFTFEEVVSWNVNWI